MEIAYGARRAGQRFVGNSCPGRCSTLLNYCGMSTDLMPYIAEQPTSLKLGQLSAGQAYSGRQELGFVEEQPDYVVLLAWHYAKPIGEQLRARGLKSKFISRCRTFKCWRARWRTKLRAS